LRPIFGKIDDLGRGFTSSRTRLATACADASPNPDPREEIRRRRVVKRGRITFDQLAASDVRAQPGPRQLLF